MRASTECNVVLALYLAMYVCPLCTNTGPRLLKRKWSRARHQGQGRAARARLARGYWHQAAKRAWIQPMPDFGIRRERSKRMRLSKAPRHRRGPAFPSPLGRAAAGRATASETRRRRVDNAPVPVAHLLLARFQHSSDSSASTSVPSPVLIPPHHSLFGHCTAQAGSAAAGLHNEHTIR